MNKLQRAAQEYLDRQSRKSHPSGRTDNGGRWYPDESEECKCCNSIREPSRTYPWSLMNHCRTATHVATLYNVSRKDLLKSIKELKNE